MFVCRSSTNLIGVTSLHIRNESSNRDFCSASGILELMPSSSRRQRTGRSFGNLVLRPAGPSNTWSIETACRDRRLRTRLAVARRDTARARKRSRAVVGRSSSTITRVLICRSISSRRRHSSLTEGIFSSSRPRMDMAGAGGSRDRSIFRRVWTTPRRRLCRRRRRCRWRWSTWSPAWRIMRLRMRRLDISASFPLFLLVAAAATATAASSLPHRRLDMATRVAWSSRPVGRRRSVAWRARTAARTSVSLHALRLTSWFLPPSRSTTSSPIYRRRLRAAVEQCR